ncbi:MAG: PQQ-dependent sugar dehydrogenase [Alkalispirochaeta sp.]
MSTRTQLVLPGLILALSLLTLGACVTVESDVPTVQWSEDETISAATVETVAGGFDHPWGVAWLPDRSMLITERGGRLWLLSPDGETRQEVGNPPQVFTGGQAGLLDISVAPDYESSGWIYLTYAAGSRDANRTEVARARLDRSAPNAPQLVDREVIAGVNAYKSGTQHFGSRIAWLPDGTLLVSIGDGGNPPLRFDGGLQREQAQEADTLFGSVIRLNPDGTLPPDAQDAFYTIGHRNVQGMAVDPTDGTVWVSEHGSRGGDELNRLIPGENYGWPEVSHSREYLRGTPVSRFQTRPEYADPTLVWMETMAPSGLAIQDGTLYAGGLQSEALHVVTVASDDSFMSHRVLPIGARVRDVRVGPDDRLYLLTDESPNGRLLRVSWE